MYLVDTNVWLERLLDQERSDEVAALFRRFNSSLFALTNFSFHSICVIMSRLQRNSDLLLFIQDLFIKCQTEMISLDPKEIAEMLQIMDAFTLDFDDAYQYQAAEKYNLLLVSFDSDFDRTERGRFTPAQIV